MKSKSVLRRLEQLEKRVLPQKRSGNVTVFVLEGETVDLSEYEGCNVTVIVEDELPE